MRPTKFELLLIGAGGHCRSCIDVIEQEGRFRIAGVVDKVGEAESSKLKAERGLEEISGKRKAESGKSNTEVLGYPLNMVRARVVKHPKEWSHGGYPEIVEPQQRCRIINRDLLKRLLDIDDDLSEVYSEWIQAAVDERTPRQPGWTESVAVGCKKFVERVKELLGGKACGRRVNEVGKTGTYALKEPVSAYNDVFEGKMGILRSENRLIWDIYPDI